MKKNVPNQFVDISLVLKASGDDAVGLQASLTVRVKQDGSVWGNAAGTLKEGENGSYEYEPTQAETNCDHLVVKFTHATILTDLVNIYPVDVNEYKADTTNLPTKDEQPIFGRQYKATHDSGQTKFETLTDEQVP